MNTTSFDLAHLCNAADLHTLENSDAPIPAYKETLKHCTAQFNDWFAHNAPIERIIRGRAQIMDKILQSIWRRKIDASSGITLIAVGGYGRGELHPSSDIDLLILIRDDPEPFNALLEQFVMFLWDIGLAVGHSVRTFSECLAESKKDVTIATNLIESRHLCGDQALFNDLGEKNKDIWEDLAFFQAKKNEQTRRYLKFNDTAYNLEPNLKDGPGGLRDIQTIGWIAKRHFGVYSMRALLEKSFLTQEEFHLLRHAREFLWRVRFALHTLTGRHEDRLLFDHQQQVAAQLGFVSDAEKSDVEHLMRAYYRTAMKVGRLNEMLLQLLEEAILAPNTPANITPLTEDFQARNQYLEVISEDVFQRRPSALLETFLLLQKHPTLTGIRASTIRLIRQYRDLIDADFRADPENKSLFMSILRQPHGITDVLRRMNRYGVLAAYLPVFEKIVGQMQYDLFHHYTVDEHTLFVIRNLRRLTVKEFSHELPFLSRLMQNIPKPERLYLAALFHDIGKGRGGNHSELGAIDAQIFCAQHGVSRQDNHIICWLVENHLLMSVTAQRKDISDPDVVHEFASKVSNVLRLKYLYLLTAADIRATNPTLWNSWKDNLLNTLYKSTYKMLITGLDLPVDQAEFARNTRKLAKIQLHHAGLSDSTIEQVWRHFEDDYFLRCHETLIAFHTQKIAEHGACTTPLVLAHNHPSCGGTEVFVYMPNSPCIFAVTTAVLDQLLINIVDAWVVTTSHHYTVDSFQILDANGERIIDPYQIQMLVDKLTDAFVNIEHYPLGISRRIPRRVKHFEQTTDVRFFQNEKAQRTMISIYTTDRPGLLSRIGLAFSQMDIHLHNAKIATIGARVEDWFYVTDHLGNPITNTQKLEQLEKLLIALIEEH